MEAIYELGKFFPSGTSDDVLNKYLSHHLASATSCVESEMYSSAYSHPHLLYMTFVYIQLMRIAREKQEEFKYSWIGFPKHEKDFLNKPTSPFSFSKIQEKTVFRFFRLVDFDDSTIANISGVIKLRNDRLHASGSLYCATADEFGQELSSYMNKMEQVVKKQKSFLEDIYVGLSNTFDDEYVLTRDDIEIQYTDQYHFSEYELDILSLGKDDKVSKFIRQELIY